MYKLKKGFTLVELIVVIGVLAILAVGAVLAFRGIQDNARRAALRDDVNRVIALINTHNSGNIINPVGYTAENRPSFATPPAGDNANVHMPVIPGANGEQYDADIFLATGPLVGAVGGVAQLRLVGIPQGRSGTATVSYINFPSTESLLNAVNAIRYYPGPDGTQGSFRPDEERIAAWDTRSPMQGNIAIEI